MRSPCPQCCSPDKSWIKACSCQRWNPADWTTGSPCAAHQVKCVYVCLAGFLSDDDTRTIAERYEEIAAAAGTSTPFVVKSAAGRCYQLLAEVVNELPEGAEEILLAGQTATLATGCADESCVSEPAGDAYVKFTNCIEGVTGDWWGCRSRLPMNGLRFIGASCWYINQSSTTANTITGTLLDTGTLIQDATCCSCKNRRNSVGTPWTTPFPCDNQPEVTGVTCSHADLRRRTTYDGTITVSKRCCCGQCAGRSFAVTGLTYTETSTDTDFSYTGTMTDVAYYRSDGAGNPSTWDNYLTITYNFVTVTNGVTVSTPMTKTIAVNCAATGYPYGPGVVTGSTSPLPDSAPFPQNIGTVSGTCSSTTYSFSTSVTSGTSTSTWAGSGTVTISAGGC